jgi:RNA polymerase sigma-70 factor (ECF subfamily)
MSRDDAQQDEDLLPRLAHGEGQALAELFARHRDRLRAMIRIRLDRRLRCRIDPSDVLQETYLEAARRTPEYLARQSMPPFLCLRLLASQKLLALHRHYLGTRMRGEGHELSIHQGRFPQASSASLAEMLLGRLTSPTLAARRAEMQVRLQDLLNSMDPIDREILALRHFEELSNGEAAQVLGLSKTAASNRYLRALERLKDLLKGMPGYLDT